jgi:hypothetical protein
MPGAMKSLNHLAEIVRSRPGGGQAIVPARNWAHMWANVRSNSLQGGPGEHSGAYLHFHLLLLLFYWVPNIPQGRKRGHATAPRMHKRFMCSDTHRLGLAIFHPKTHVSTWLIVPMGQGGMQSCSHGICTLEPAEDTGVQEHVSIMISRQQNYVNALNRQLGPGLP